MLIHLAKYKRECLGIAEPGVFRWRGQALVKDHILPTSNRDHNLLPSIRQQFGQLTDTAAKQIRLHQFFHHLNSSQALAINLFLPLLGSDSTKFSQLLRFDEALTIAGFEHVVDHDGTNVDFFAQESRGQTLSVEVKLTEKDFGKAKPDKRHIEKFHSVYRPSLEGIAILPVGSEQEAFFENYQFFRNAILAAQNNRVWFLIPRDNCSIVRRLKTCRALLSSEARPLVQPVFLEDFLNQVTSLFADNASLVSHYGELRQKYILS